MKSYSFGVVVLLLTFTTSVLCQGSRTAPDRRVQMTGNTLGVHILFGDLRVEGIGAKDSKPLLYEVVLMNLGGTPVGSQFVASGGRYRFQNLQNGQYELAVRLENEEVARTRVEIMAPFQNDFRQDLSLRLTPGTSPKPGTLSAADHYKRTDANENLFTKSREATDQKRYDDAVMALKKLVEQDPKDFQAWTELGTVYLFKQSYDDSEQAYLKATAERPTFFLAQMNLGRLRYMRKNYEASIEPLTKAVEIQPTSADANYYLGEAFLQIKKGSKAIGYLYEALKLDPVAKADAHLDLAALYNAVGYKDKAAAEYEAFLKKKPDHPNRKKLEQYIVENKPAETKKP